MTALHPLFTEDEIRSLRERSLPRPTANGSLEAVRGSVLFGAGRFTRAVLAAIEGSDIEPAWIIDNNEALWGTTLAGIEIRPPSSLAETGERLVFIMTDYLLPMSRQCTEAGVRNWTWFSDIYDVFGSFSLVTDVDTLLDNADISRAASLLRDDCYSLEVFKKALQVRVTGDMVDLPPLYSDQYFATGLAEPRYYRHFVDCGAFNGDTLEAWTRFVHRHHLEGATSYHAIEPDRANFEALELKCSSLDISADHKVFLHNCAVGRENTVGSIVSGGAGTTIYGAEIASQSVSIRALSELLKGQPVTCIKMDLEGYEPDALEGSKALITAHRPLLTIAIYHRVEHLWQIPLWIQSLDMGYTLRLRHHDTTPSETICYAIPEGCLSTSEQKRR